MYHSLLLIIVSCGLLVIRADQLYSDKYDNIDIDGILANDKLRTEYYNCFMDQGPCSENAEFFKGNFPEVIATQCMKCTDWQKNAMNKIASWFSDNDEQAWNAFVNKYMQSAKEVNIAYT